MKSRLVLGLWLVLFGVFCSGAQNAKDGPAVIFASSGKVYYRMGEAKWKAAALGTVVTQGMTLRTGARSQADVRIPAAGVFRLTPKTIVEIEKLGLLTNSATHLAIPEVILNVKQGRITGDTQKMPAGSRYEVRTPKGTVSIPP